MPSPWPPHPYQRPRNTSTPTLFAVRQLGAGRVALLNQWRQFSIGSGSRWLYDNIVMEDGLPGMPSDMAKMVRLASTLSLSCSVRAWLWRGGFC